MLKQIATVGTLVLTLTGCVTPQTADLKVQTVINKTTGSFTMGPAAKQKQIDLENIGLSFNTKNISDAISSLKKHVGKTWYVFSGNTPSGWDCSGLTMWFYQQLGVELEHRASKQDTAGIEANDPKPGDIVVFKYKGYNDAYHVGIYIGDGLMIHAPKHGHVTRIENVKTFGGSYSKISYRRIIDSL